MFNVCFFLQRSREFSKIQIHFGLDTGRVSECVGNLFKMWVLRLCPRSVWPCVVYWPQNGILTVTLQWQLSGHCTLYAMLVFSIFHFLQLVSTFNLDSHGDHRFVSTVILDELSSVAFYICPGIPRRGHVFLISPVAQLSLVCAALQTPTHSLPHTAALLTTARLWKSTGTTAQWYTCLSPYSGAAALS